MRFSVKKDVWVTLLVWIPMIIAFAIVIASPMETTWIYLMVILTFLLTFAFMAWIWFASYYELKEDRLFVSFGPIKENILYKDITKIKESHNLLSSAALSLDRLSIYKTGRLKTLISPQEKEVFLDQIKSFIPHAEIIRKTQS